MKCYECGREAHVAVRHQAMVMSKENIFFYCRSCFEGRPIGSTTQDVTGEKASVDALSQDTIVLCPECGTRNSRTDSQCRACDKDLTEAKKRLVEDFRKREKREGV